MRKILFVIQFFVFLFSCSGGHNKENCHKDGVLSVLKKNIDKESCFVEDHAKFVSLVFFETKDKRLVQVCSYIDRPFKDNNKFYYKEDPDYMFVCIGFCDDFVRQNGFLEWNDSIDKHYLNFWHLFESSDSATYDYFLKHNNFNSTFYEYNNNSFVRLDSLTYEEQDSVASQLSRFDLGYCIMLPPPSFVRRDGIDDSK